MKEIESKIKTEIENIHDYISRLHYLQLEMLEVQKNIDKTREEKELIEYEEIKDINSEENKKKYPNQTIRDLELKSRLKTKVPDLDDIIKGMQYSINEKKISIELYNKKISVLKLEIQYLTTLLELGVE